MDLVSWDVDNAYLLLHAPITWVEFTFVLSYSGLTVYVPTGLSVGDMCAMRDDYHSDDGSLLGLVEGIASE